MIAYVDASVLLRVALRQPDALPEWRQIEQGIASALIMTESLRTWIGCGYARIWRTQKWPRAARRSSG